MATEERPRRSEYRAFLLMLKIIPMLLALCTGVSTLLNCFGIDLEAFSYIGGVSLLTLAFLYIAAACFRFCAYHRMFLHYVLVVNMVNIYDTYVGLPVSNTVFVGIQVSLICLLLFIVLCLYLRRKLCFRH